MWSEISQKTYIVFQANLKSPFPSLPAGDKTAAVQRIDSGKERLRGGVLLTLCAALVHLLEVR